MKAVSRSVEAADSSAPRRLAASCRFASIRVLFEAALPIGGAFAPATRQERQDTRNFVCFRYLAQADVGHVGERNHHRHAAVKEFEEVKSFELRPKSPGTDVFNGPNPLIGVNHFLTDHEGH